MEARLATLTARRVSPQFILIASVITTEFVTLTVTVFVKGAFRPALGRALFSLSEKLFSTIPAFTK